MGIDCLICKSAKTHKIINKNTFSIVKCYCCKNAFTHPLPTVPLYEEKDFHSKDNPTDHLINVKDLPWEWRKSIRMQVSLITKHLPQSKSILEIGCGEGILAGELVKRNYNVVGIEPSHSACERARKRGIDIYQGYFPVSAIEEKFDLIIMSHVLEHIKDSEGVLKTIRNFLKEEGLLLLVQTNFEGLMPKLYKSKWYAWVPEEHFWHFTPYGLKFLATTCGFSELEYEYSSLVHSKHGGSKANFFTKFVPFLRDQFHILFKVNKNC